MGEFCRGDEALTIIGVMVRRAGRLRSSVVAVALRLQNSIREEDGDGNSRMDSAGSLPDCLYPAN